MRNLLESLQVELGFGAKTLSNTTENGTGVDMKGASDALLISAGGAAAPSVAGTIKIQDSDDNSTWADVTGASITYADTDDDKVGAVRIHCPNHARYLRAVGIEAGTANWLVGAVWVIAPKVLPPTAPTISTDTDAIS